MERTAAILHKLQSAEYVDAVCPEVTYDLLTLCDAEQVILYAVGRETRDLYVKFACEPCAGKWAERIPMAKDNVLGYCALRGKVLNMGVLVLINKRSSSCFTVVEEDCAREIADTLNRKTAKSNSACRKGATLSCAWRRFQRRRATNLPMPCSGCWRSA